MTREELFRRAMEFVNTDAPNGQRRVPIYAPGKLRENLIEFVEVLWAEEERGKQEQREALSPRGEALLNGAKGGMKL
jgi:hypothetical protein